LVDFGKRLAGKKIEKKVEPTALYESLDRAHDKGPLRPAQTAVLNEWFENQKNARDVIVKLHTGQGKTLVGLLMLQSRLNAGHGPAVYLCPNNNLIDQTCEQAKQFGIKTCVADSELPDEFLAGDQILVTSVQKMFNGRTKFGLNNNSVLVDTILMDDAHACADAIREACRIRIPYTEPAYAALKALFDHDLEAQGVGEHADINNHKRDAFLPVPYWAWLTKESDVARILAAHTDKKSVKFAWPLLKNMLIHCHCLISGVAIEIEPNLAPLAAFGSYSKAKQRIFMSATVTDDAFLIKGLELAPDTIKRPLSYEKETWSGEKMILLPSLIDPTLDRDTMIMNLGRKMPDRSYGVVALVPSAYYAEAWKAYGALFTNTENVTSAIGELRKGKFDTTLILMNRYDGIDLPDDTCRILAFDAKPYSESLSDLYQEFCRADSEATLMRTVRSVEQGMGRSVRGEKDYSVIVVLGQDLVRLLRDKSSRKHLSSQMAKQIEIGLEIADLAKQEIEEGEKPLTAFLKLVRQCLSRDESWKEFYIDQMSGVTPKGANEKLLDIYSKELDAERSFQKGQYEVAVRKIQAMLDGGLVNAEDKGWYLQEMARYFYQRNRPESQRLQIAAHSQNRLLLRPESGMQVAKLTVVSQGRVERIRGWVSGHGTYIDLDATVSDILARLSFGTRAEKFESALDELSKALGFAGERPDKEWKEGPDNLWAVEDARYILWECKSEVATVRAEVNKTEAEQMNRSSAWFEKHYPGCSVKRIIIHPAGKIESAAHFTHDVEVMRQSDLKKLVRSVREFFKAFEGQNLNDLSVTNIQTLLNSHKLSVDDLTSGYSDKLKDLR